MRTVSNALPFMPAYSDYAEINQDQDDSIVVTVHDPAKIKALEINELPESYTIIGFVCLTLVFIFVVSAGISWIDPSTPNAIGVVPSLITAALLTIIASVFYLLSKRYLKKLDSGAEETRILIHSTDSEDLAIIDLFNDLDERPSVVNHVKLYNAVKDHPGFIIRENSEISLPNGQTGAAEVS